MRPETVQQQPLQAGEDNFGRRITVVGVLWDPGSPEVRLILDDGGEMRFASERELRQFIRPVAQLAPQLFGP